MRVEDSPAGSLGNTRDQIFTTMAESSARCYTIDRIGPKLRQVDQTPVYTWLNSSRSCELPRRKALRRDSRYPERVREAVKLAHSQLREHKSPILGPISY
jgi:hypothetical protein